MRAEVVISSEYEATWCGLKGVTFRIVPSSKDEDVDYIFDDNKALREARRQFAEDVDLQEFIEAHRRLRWATNTAIKGKAGDRGVQERGPCAATKNRQC